ncbi:hypothetical protein E2C01_076874 [Portunus trituberculatus]|uniref:Uncharacterized protein n=1 Tax=Portunus trituberculatus TaxID=210409 RepID=A0A5B7IIU6_PORTR|nr:hypothetical protein [Portunus trituberculatus]
MSVSSAAVATLPIFGQARPVRRGAAFVVLNGGDHMAVRGGGWRGGPGPDTGVWWWCCGLPPRYLSNEAALVLSPAVLGAVPCRALCSGPALCRVLHLHASTSRDPHLNHRQPCASGRTR